MLELNNCPGNGYPHPDTGYCVKSDEVDYKFAELVFGYINTCPSKRAAYATANPYNTNATFTRPYTYYIGVETTTVTLVEKFSMY